MSDGLFGSLDISASALSAERLRMNVIAGNLANASVLSTPEGGPYKRRVVVFEPTLQNLLKNTDSLTSQGVRTRVAIDKTPGERRPDPGNPLADASGMVEQTNVKPMFEMVDLMVSSRAYEANLSAMKTYREMVQRTIQMSR